jgi:alpha-galactosidase
MMVEKIINQGRYPAKVISTTNRREALKGAAVVVCTISASPVEVWRLDIEIPKKYGVDFTVGDTRGVAGIFRALRTIPVMVGICRDMEEMCPNAIFLNYTNPMSMLCRAMQKSSFIKLAGLCHSVQGLGLMLTNWITETLTEEEKCKMIQVTREKNLIEWFRITLFKVLNEQMIKEQITYVCAGINHQAWFIEFKKHGKDAYPLLREKLKNKEFYMFDYVRNEMFLQLGYYVTESSGHNSEYNWWFRKRPDLIEKYNIGECAAYLKEYLEKSKHWKEENKAWLDQRIPVCLERGTEYASYIINALLGGEPFKFNGNVPNTNLITNLPKDACVEVPVLANKRGFNPIYVGALPPQCAALNNINIASEEMAVDAALTGDPTLLCRAVYFDPLSAAVLSLAEIKKMVQEMLKVNEKYLPQFKSVKL